MVDAGALDVFVSSRAAALLGALLVLLVGWGCALPKRVEAPGKPGKVFPSTQRWLATSLYAAGSETWSPRTAAILSSPWFAGRGAQDDGERGVSLS